MSKLLVEKWQEFLEAEGVPAIVTASKKKLVARILEQQESDLLSSGLLAADWDQVDEAEISGVAGTAANIASGQNSGNIVYSGPTVMGIVRRTVPQMMAFDTIGIQPLTQPTGQVFCLRSVYGGDASLIGADGINEAFRPGIQPRVGHSGTATTASFGAFTAIGVAHVAVVPGAYMSWAQGAVELSDVGTRYFKNAKTTNFAIDSLDTQAEIEAAIADGSLTEIGEGLATNIAEVMEGFNGSSGNAFNEMSFRIDKQGVEAKSRQLKAQYSIELAQDLRAVHGLDADTELSNLLANEIMVEQNREVVVLMNAHAQTGCAGKTAISGGSGSGVFTMSNSTDNRGARWAGEQFKSLLIQIEKEANEIGRATGRGNGNFILASRNVVSALAMTDVFVSPAAQGMQNGTLNTDTNTSVFAGVLGGRFKVFIDQYAYEDYCLVGYKGPNEMDAGLYYSPYVALTPLRGSDSKNLQPVIAFKTRYGLSVNPFVAPEAAQLFSNSLARGVGANQYFRRFRVVGI